MDKEIKKEWIEALGSGGYEQGRNQLAERTLNGDMKYCCLGVLCEIAVKHGIIKKEVLFGSMVIYGPDDDFGTVGALPNQVVAWARTPDANPYIEDMQISLTGLNDSGRSFEQIADIIERAL